MMANAAENVRRNTSSIRQLRSAGEMLTPGIQKKVVQRFGLPVREAMGSTESLHMISSYRFDEAVREACFGRPIPGFEIVVRDPDTMEELPRGEVGVLSFRGPTGTKYWRKPEIQAKAVRNGWSILQDAMRMDDEGFCHYIGRQDEMIVSSGYNIAPTDVESVLAKHPSVLESACIGAPDPEQLRTEVVRACVVLREGIEASAQLGVEIQEFFKRNGAPYAYPRIVEFVKALPKTASGKIRRVDLRAETRSTASGAGKS
jgi:2-aminobenzoate-CoA ligase